MIPYVETIRVWSAAERKTYSALVVAPGFMVNATYANRDGRKDVLHPLPHFREPLMLESLPVAGLTLEIWLVLVVLDISLIVGLGFNGSKAVTWVDRLVIGLSQQW
jgi:hypothetical protein